MEKLRKFSKEKIWRIIPSRYPPINLFERVSSPQDWEFLYEIEAMTNDRLRDEIGDISLVRSEDRVFGSGAGYIMSAFTHLNPVGSRFSDNTYGVYYASDTLDCAIGETKYHREKFLSFTDEPAIDLEMRVLIAELNGSLHDISSKAAHELFDPEDYRISQQFARKLREAESLGIYYPSVRYEKGYCYAVFKPRAISKCRQERHLIYRWNGKKIEHVFEVREVKA
jgi:hypothetical protein